MAGPTHATGRAHLATPICYERYHIQLDGPEACWTVVLGAPIWGASWPELRAKIDQALGYAGSSDHPPMLNHRRAA
jgi:hypothetical protein